MLLRIPQLLSDKIVTHVRQTLDQSTFIDGKKTAGWHAKLVKHNQQLSANAPESEALKTLVKEAIAQNQLFQSAVRPKVVHSLLFSRYDEGMSYGRHTDNALMGGSSFYRSDVSFTIFLNRPSDYDGGELVIEGADDERAYKLDPGTALVYPSTTLHRVNAVTRGTRLVVVGWVQSLIREAGDRELLFDLETARRSLFAKDGKSDEFDLISKSLTNLLRKWAE